ncbi:MAG: hypothetical protein ACFB5Z_17815 [Elainellaceae cyanobacterium]
MTFLAFLSGTAACVFLYIGFQQYQAWRDYRRYSQGVLTLLTIRDKHHLRLSRELGLSLRRLNPVLRCLEKRRLIQGYWGPYVIALAKGPRYRFYRLVHRVPADVPTPALASSLY